MGRQESRVPVSGGDLAVVDYGGSGPDVILIHSVGHCSAVWEDVAAALGEDAHVVALDLRGHGQSSAEATEADEADEATGFAQITSDLLAVVDTLGLRRPVLVGHDVSGGFATAAAATAPDRIGALVVIDSPTVEPQATVREMARMVGSDAVLDMLTQRFGLGRTGTDTASREAFVARYCAHNAMDLLAAAPDETTMRALMQRSIVVEDDGSWVHRPLPETMRVLTRDPHRPTAHPGRELLAGVQVPVCAVILSDGRHGSGGDGMAELAKERPSVRVLTLDTGPYVLYTHPEAVAGAILETAGQIHRHT